MPDGGIKADFPHIANTIDTAIRAGHMQQIILVGIENTQQRRDMTGPTNVAEDRNIAPQIHNRYRATDESGIIGKSAAA